jgi:hypothetical protein
VTAEPAHTRALAERFWRARLGAPLPPLSQLSPALPWPPSHTSSSHTGSSQKGAR